MDLFISDTVLTKSENLLKKIWEILHFEAKKVTSSWYIEEFDFKWLYTLPPSEIARDKFIA